MIDFLPTANTRDEYRDVPLNGGACNTSVKLSVLCLKRFVSCGMLQYCDFILSDKSALSFPVGLLITHLVDGSTRTAEQRLEVTDDICQIK